MPHHAIASIDLLVLWIRADLIGTGNETEGPGTHGQRA